MKFDKIINDMQELQNKIKVYEEKNKKIEDALNSLKKETLKLEKKIADSKDNIDKHILGIRLEIMKEIIGKFEVKNG